MTTPGPADGKFVNSDAVVARLEGKTPSAGRVTTIKWRILDVDNELMGEGPSLRDIEVASTDPAVKIRIGRVRTLSRLVAQAYYDSRERLGFPMLPAADQPAAA